MQLRSFAIALALTSALALVFSCKGANSTMDTASEGEACALGSRTTKTCSGTLHCAPKPYAPVASGKGPSEPSPEGGSCGGVAGFHCADGLACHLEEKDQVVADAMGTCMRESVCVK
ncbi:hypothetical protein BH09MYX1_BH09MYX1_24430 [soil metagenome]